MQLFPLLEKATRTVLVRQGVTARTVETSVGTTHLYDAPGTGTLPPVLLVHGFGASAAGFARVLTALRPHVSRVLAPDLPSHGLSGPARKALEPDVVYQGLCETLARSDAPRAIVVGNSLGGALTVRYALEHPERVHGLFLTSPAGPPMSEDELASVRAIFRPRDNAEAKRFFTRAYAKPSWLYTVLAPSLRTHFSQRHFQEFLSNASERDWFSPAQVRALSVPVHLTWGRADRILPASLLEFYRAHLPAGSVIEEPHDEAHCPHVDDPHGLARRVAEFARAVTKPK